MSDKNNKNAERVKNINNIILRNHIVNFALKDLKTKDFANELWFYFQLLNADDTGWGRCNKDKCFYRNRKASYIVAAKEEIESLGYSIEEQKCHFKLMSTKKKKYYPLVWVITKK